MAAPGRFTKGLGFTAARASLHGFLINAMDLLHNLDDQQLRVAKAIRQDSETILKMNSSDPGALFLKGFALRFFPVSTPNVHTYWQDSKDAYDQYLMTVEKDDRVRPAANYHAGFLTMLLEGPSKFNSQREGANEPTECRGNFNKTVLKKVLQYYTKGLDAESVRLPIFAPVGPISSKEMLALLAAARKDSERRSSSTSPPGSSAH